MLTQQLIIFISGLIILIIGVALMAYGALQKQTRLGDAEDKYAQILKALSVLVGALGKYLGANLAAKVGLLLVIIGLFLIVFSSIHVQIPIWP